MNRYFFFVTLINSINNIIIFLPRVLSQDRYHGALMSILFALPFGTILLYFFIKAMMKFPNQGIPEMFKATTASLSSDCNYAVFLGSMVCSGLLMLSALVEMVQRFINPDISVYVLLALFVAVALFAIRTEGSTVLYALEISLFFIVPMIVFYLVNHQSVF